MRIRLLRNTMVRGLSMAADEVVEVGDSDGLYLINRGRAVLVDEVAKEPDGETAKEPDGETAKEPDGETAKEPDGETAKEPDGETAKAPGGEKATRSKSKTAKK